MLQLFVIACFAAVVLHDQSHASGELAQSLAGISWFTHALLLVGPFGVVIAMQLIGGAIATKSLERTGAWQSIARFDLFTLLCRAAALALLWIDVITLGWIDFVRDAIGLLRLGGRYQHLGEGNLILIDELLIVAPPMLVIVAGWWAVYPIDRRLREARLIATLDQGRPYYPPSTRLGFVVMQARHQLGLAFVPLCCLLALRETAGIAIPAIYDAARGVENPGWFMRAIRAATSRDARDVTMAGIQLLGVFALVILMPLGIRFLWDTVPVREGELVGRLTAMAHRVGVRVNQLLIWRTGGTMINGAVLGAIGWARHILLTDALIESLPGRQVLAVLAHELGHVRRKHIVWLGVGCVSIVVLASFALQVLLLGWKPNLSSVDPSWLTTIDYTIAIGGMLIGAFAFGWISRRFEWQADAFAVQTLSVEFAVAPLPSESPELVDSSSSSQTVSEGGESAPAVDVPTAITPAAVDAMIGALDSVASLNHIPVHRFSFRHGSIARRIENLRALVGVPLNRAPIDRTVGRIKAMSAFFAAVAMGVIVWESLQSPPEPRRRPVTTDEWFDRWMYEMRRSNGR